MGTNLTTGGQIVPQSMVYTEKVHFQTPNPLLWTPLILRLENDHTNKSVGNGLNEFCSCCLAKGHLLDLPRSGYLQHCVLNRLCMMGKFCLDKIGSGTHGL